METLQTFPTLIHKFMRENNYPVNSLPSYLKEERKENPFSRKEFLAMAERVVREYKIERGLI